MCTGLPATFFTLLRTLLLTCLCCKMCAQNASADFYNFPSFSLPCISIDEKSKWKQRQFVRLSFSVFLFLCRPICRGFDKSQRPFIVLLHDDCDNGNDADDQPASFASITHPPLLSSKSAKFSALCCHLFFLVYSV